MFNKSALLALLVAVLLGISAIGPHLQRYVRVAGVFRQPRNTLVPNADHLLYIDDTVHCEDISYHRESNQLFLACEDNPEGRFQWLPPVALFRNSSRAEHNRGSIHVIDPQTKSSRRLEFVNFSGPFNTHGIDVISDPDSTKPAVYIFAVNHVPDPSTCAGSTTHQDCVWRSSSRVEVFHHILGSTTVSHVRSVAHPLISTPNDVLARDPYSFYVTNDYFYKEGPLRQLELMFWPARWSTTIFVEFQRDSPPSATDGVTAKVALEGLYNQNGLSRGRKGEIIIGRAGAGAVEIGHISAENDTISVVDTLYMDSTVDNPSYFTDPYADEMFDGSGYVIAGLARAIDILDTTTKPEALDGSMVWFIPTRPKDNRGVIKASDVTPRLIFEDDGKRLRFATTAVLVGIDPKLEGGQRWAWLFVTGLYSKAAVAVKVNLETFV